jgi:hypothetical protein
MHGQLRPQGWELVLSSVARPLQDVVAGLMFAVSGVFVEPYKGAQLKGFAGLSKGIGIGTIGLVAKPLVGVFDAFAHVSESIHDVARSANILDKKSTCIRRMRLPYVFGLQKLLLPYNPVDAYCANILRLFPFVDEKRLQMDDTEVLILSVLIQKEPGVGWYVIVTTHRILKVIVRYDSYLPPLLEWQVKMMQTNEITSTIEHATHNQVVLRIVSIPEQINRTRVKKSPLQLSQGYHECEADDDYESNTFDNQTPDSMNRKRSRHNPVQSAFGALSTYKTRKKEISAHCISGDFQTERDALIQIHNAICCITKQFDSILSRNYSGRGSLYSEREGHTSFGPLHFGEELDSVLDVRNNISNQLDRIPWVYFVESKKKNRLEWTYQDELEASRSLCDGPQWVAETMATSTVLSPSTHSVSEINALEGEKKKPAVQLKCSTASSDNQEKITNYLSSLNSDISVKKKERAGFNIVADDEETLLLETDGSAGIHTKNSTLEERLQHIEAVLQCLLNGQSSVQVDIDGIFNKNQNNPNQSASNISAVSALTGAGEININKNFTTNFPLNETVSETDQLKLEIKLLQEQLANKEAGTESQLRKKRKLKKFWKH